MTDRLYYNDPYLQAFDAFVLRVADRGGRAAVTLDRTAFYPTSGGQPFDTGALGPFRVVDVVDEDDGTISHIIEAGPADPESRIPKPEAGQSLRGAVDWPRRFDHMQQHTGQHVLSAAFERLFGARTVSFHLGADSSTIDLARELSAGEIAAGEDAANAVVWEDRPVGIRYATAEEAAKLPLRKEPARGGTLRLIDVDGHDLSACGGTHVSRTGSIGVIAVARWERFKGGQRIEFVCGGRALRAHRSLRDAMSAGVRLLSVLPEELPASIERLQTEAREQKRAITGLQTELARYRAEELAASGETVRLKPPFDAAQGGPEAVEGPDPTEMSCRLIARAMDADASVLKSLATAVTTQPGFIVMLVSTSTPVLAVVARSSDVAISAQTILSTLIGTFGGRGGGRPELAQGGGLVGAPDEILAAARTFVTG
jgi:alanyl-tRNA synthetase